MLSPASGWPVRCFFRVAMRVGLLSTVMSMGACGNRGDLYLESSVALEREIQGIGVELPRGEALDPVDEPSGDRGRTKSPASSSDTGVETGVETGRAASADVSRVTGSEVDPDGTRPEVDDGAEDTVKDITEDESGAKDKDAPVRRRALP